MRIADDEVVYLDSDQPPASGKWLDPHDDALDEITPEDAAAGERLGELIDQDDDDDSGLQYIGGGQR
ncbi:MAG TPA: hypothetical protein VFR23_05230 [Jiangellaceae bacterium]|nr:hypothetical protein [Jiangellaceae bacterium]